MNSVSRTPRQFLAPRSEGLKLTLDDMELYEHVDSPLGNWCRKVLAVEREKTLDEIGADRFLPRGVIDPEIEGGILVAALVNQSGQVWSRGGWCWPDSPVEMDKTIDMDEAAVAFVARAQIEGADAVLFRDPLPLALISAVDDGAGSSAMDAPPDGAVMVAIVDGFDRNAVLELLAVSPGPAVHRRNDGKWYEDPEWVNVLKSVQPPPMVKLEDELLASVVSQVDSTTAGQDFEPFKAKERTKYITSSSYVTDLAAEADAALIASNLAVVAVAGRELSPKDIKNTEQLRRYWLYGKGAAKIRWGTPGAWRRCYRNVVKYMGPKMAPGYCTNLSKRLGGPGVATHVGD